MPLYCRVCKYSLFLHLFKFIAIHKHVIHTFLTLTLLEESEYLVYKTNLPGKVISPGKSVRANTRFTLILVICFSCIVFGTWLNMSTSIFNPISFNHNLSFVQYNIQSISSKIELLKAELFHFDTLAFTETWLSPSVDTDDLVLQS